MYAVTRLYTWDRKNTLTLCRHPPPLAPKIATTFIQQSPHGPSTTFSADLFGPGVAQRWTAHTQLVWRGRSHRRSARHRVTMEVPSRVNGSVGRARDSTGETAFFGRSEGFGGVVALVWGGPDCTTWLAMQ